MSRLKIAAVIYNKPVSELASVREFKALKEQFDDVDLILFDNSDKDIYGNRAAAEELGIEYMTEGMNIGLSRAYNLMLGKAADDDWILFADDDTNFSMAYLRNVRKAAFEKGYEIITGIVKSGDVTASPIRNNPAFRRRRLTIDKPGIYKDIYAINSGLTLRAGFLREVGGFAEQLFLDMVDFELMDRLISCNKNRIAVIPGSIHQHFEGVDFSDEEAVRARFRRFRNDFKNYCSLTDKSLLYKKFIPLKRQINIELHCRSFNNSSEER